MYVYAKEQKARGSNAKYTGSILSQRVFLRVLFNDRVWDYNILKRGLRLYVQTIGLAHRMEGDTERR